MTGACVNDPPARIPRGEAGRASRPGPTLRSATSGAAQQVAADAGREIAVASGEVDVAALVGPERAGRLRVGQAEFMAPMLATLTATSFSDPDWVFERKLDFCAWFEAVGHRSSTPAPRVWAKATGKVPQAAMQYPGVIVSVFVPPLAVVSSRHHDRPGQNQRRSRGGRPGWAQHGGQGGSEVPSLTSEPCGRITPGPVPLRASKLVSASRQPGLSLGGSAGRRCGRGKTDVARPPGGRRLRCQARRRC